MQHARSYRSKSVSDSISNLGPFRFVHVRSSTFHNGVTDFWTPRRSKNKLWNFQFQHIESHKIIPRDNQVNIKYEVYFNVTLGWNQTDFMVIRARSKTRRVSSRDLKAVRITLVHHDFIHWIDHNFKNRKIQANIKIGFRVRILAWTIKI